ANLFCSFCYLKKKDIEIWDSTKWKLQTAEEHLIAARYWKAATTFAERDEIFKESGARYSCLLELYDYWDPVTGSIIGIMHNICEGLLSNYFHRKWG
ncbi:hypothetical protein BT69DRAFT_1198540, partial [Atractiella rhizophila]